MPPQPALGTADYTVPYVAHRFAGDPTLLRDTATRVVATARAILRDTDALPAEPTRTGPPAW